MVALLAVLVPAKAQAPVLIATDPPTNTTVRALTFIDILFENSVTGVDASDLLIDGVAANDVTVVSPREYLFHFPQPPTGAVTVAWAPAHGITDLASPPYPFAGGSWSYGLNPNSVTTTILISEFMADNGSGIKDEDGTRQDWLEIYNPGLEDANLDGWFLTDTATNLVKWRLPSVFLGANKYLVVFASGKDRTNPATPLHTNFKLAKEGGYLALVDSRTNVASAFTPYPPQQTDFSYGRDLVDANLLGYFTTPTPGAQNSTGGPGFAPEPVFSLDTGIYTNSSLTLSLSAALGTIRYTLDGSLPTTNSPVYSVPITFGTNVIIKARVFPPANAGLSGLFQGGHDGIPAGQCGTVPKPGGGQELFVPGRHDPRLQLELALAPHQHRGTGHPGGRCSGITPGRGHADRHRYLSRSQFPSVDPRFSRLGRIRGLWANLRRFPQEADSDRDPRRVGQRFQGAAARPAGGFRLALAQSLRRQDDVERFSWLRVV